MMQEELIGKIPQSIEKALSKMLTPDEKIMVKLKGACKQVLVCTDKRVIILKSGFMTGQWFGLRQFQLPLEMLTSAEVNATLGVGYFEVSSGGMQNTPKGYWNGTAFESPNCISLCNSQLVGLFRKASTFILEQSAQTKNRVNISSTSSHHDIPEAIMQLWKMKNEGALTEEQYEAAKAKVIGS